MGVVPDRWGSGQLFAFSGMDGPTRAASPMVAHTLGERIGLRLHFDPPIDLWCQATRHDPLRKYPRLQPYFDVVAGDAIRLHVRLPYGERAEIAFAPISQDAIAGVTHTTLPLRCSAGTAPGSPLPAGEHAFESTQGVLAVVVQEAGTFVRFAAAHHDRDRAAAVALAQRALSADVSAIVAGRRHGLESISLPSRLPAELARTYRKAVSNLRVNTCTPEGQILHRWTTPDRWPHRWMWLHDSAYHAAGHVCHFPDLAKDMLAAVFDTQDDDGRIALLMRPDGNFPEISQSPILAWATKIVFDATGDRDFLAALYPKLRAYLEYFDRTRAFGQTGLHRWLHSDESMDNNPRFDLGAEFGAVDLSATLANEYETMGALADAQGLAGDADAWRAAHARIAQAINTLLWDEAGGQYGDLTPDGRVIAHSTCVTFLPLLAGIVPPDRARRLHAMLTDPARFWLPVPVPTVAASEPVFYPDMWRGPTWLNMNHLIALGLDRAGFAAEATELRLRTVRTVQRWYEHTGCIYEFYDAYDRIPPYAMDRKSRLCYGQGFANISDYHWSSALFIAMCRQLFE